MMMSSRIGISEDEILTGDWTRSSRHGQTEDPSHHHPSVNALTSKSRFIQGPSPGGASSTYLLLFFVGRWWWNDRHLLIYLPTWTTNLVLTVHFNLLPFNRPTGNPDDLTKRTRVKRYLSSWSLSF